MAKYKQIGKGAAFIQEKTNDKQPDFQGVLEIHDEKSFISLWKSRSKKGDRYLSIIISKKDTEDNIPPEDDLFDG